MWCKKCGGRVCVDRTFTDGRRIELACLLCGKRTFVPQENTFGVWLSKREKELNNSYAL
jgi:hypothetical protein